MGDLLTSQRSGARVASGRNCVRKARVNERITRCAPAGFSAHLRSVVQAAFAVIILLIASTGLTPSLARADTASSAAATAAARATRLRLAIWHWALRQRGKPYIWGGTGPNGFDCSGLVYAAYRSHGIRLPRTTYEMLGSWRLVRISKAQARRGDLAFFGTGHVELFAHGNWTFGAEEPGTRIGFHLMNAFWHPTMYFRIRM